MKLTAAKAGTRHTEFGEEIVKKAKVFLVLFLVLIMAMSSGCQKRAVQHDISEYRITMNYREGFRVMVLSDIHLSRFSNLDEIKVFLENNITEADPDIIVLNGDSFFDATKAEVDWLFNFIDSFSVCWVYLQGNHDRQGSFEPNYPENVVSKMVYALNVDFADDDIEGEQNFYVDLMDGDDLVYRLFMIDSGSYARMNAIKYTYARIGENQLKHIEAIQAAEDDNSYTSLAFFHIPLPEFAMAYEGYKNGDYEGFGENREGGSPSKFSTNQFERMKNAGIRGMFCAHDHINDSVIDYEGVILAYGVKADKEIYHDSDMLGYRLITLTEDDFSLDNVQNVIHDYYEYSKGSD